MNDMPAGLEARLIDLETRLAFQEATLLELSDALAASRIEAAHGVALLERALGDLRQLRGLLYADPANEPPPPHY